MALVGEWGFNEGSGSTAADSSGNGHTRSFSGSWAASAKNGAGMGVGAASVGAIGGATVTGFTFMAWVKSSLPAAGDYVGILSSVSGGDRYFEFSESGGALLLDYYTGSFLVNATSTFPAGTATHLAVTVSGSDVTLYINGVAAGTNSNGLSVNLAATDWATGAGNGDVGLPASGDWLDELRVFDSALTAGEITTWMNTPVGSAPPATAKPPVIITRPAIVRAAYI